MLPHKIFEVHIPDAISMINGLYRRTLENIRKYLRMVLRIGFHGKN